MLSYAFFYLRFRADSTICGHREVTYDTAEGIVTPTCCVRMSIRHSGASWFSYSCIFWLKPGIWLISSLFGIGSLNIYYALLNNPSFLDGSETFSCGIFLTGLTYWTECLTWLLRFSSISAALEDILINILMPRNKGNFDDFVSDSDSLKTSK